MLFPSLERTVEGVEARLLEGFEDPVRVAAAEERMFEARLLRATLSTILLRRSSRRGGAASLNGDGAAAEEEEKRACEWNL